MEDQIDVEDLERIIKECECVARRFAAGVQILDDTEDVLSR